MYRALFKMFKSTLPVLTFGFCIGFILGILFIQTSKKGKASVMEIKNITLTEEIVYQSWLHSKGLERQCYSSEQVSYKNVTNTESRFLAKNINLLCVVFIKNSKKAETIMDTWGKHCNRIIFFGVSVFDDLNVPVYNVIRPKCSWHYLCIAIRQIWLKNSKQLQWALFIPDTIFAIPENLRLIVSSLDPSTPHYLGHALYLWGESYNAAQAGYVLSRGAIELLASKFNTTEACEKSGKHWKNEDFYLGKFLGKLGVYPVDTRDHLGRGRFHAYNFNQLLFSHKLSPLSSYWKRSIYPITEGQGCCSDTSITFHGVEEDKVHQFYYLLYRLKPFHKVGYLGNIPAPTSLPENEVWRQFLVDEGILDDPPLEMSGEQFYELTRRKVMSPNLFNQALKQEADDK